MFPLHKPPTSLVPRRGATLGEVLGAFTLLAILGAVVLPQLRTRSDDPRRAVALERLATLRAAIDLYREQNRVHPDADLVLQLTERMLADDGVARGPYLRHGIPANPITGRGTVRPLVLMPPYPTGEAGWLYDTTTSEIRLNARGGPSPEERWFDL